MLDGDLEAISGIQVVDLGYPVSCQGSPHAGTPAKAGRGSLYLSRQAIALLPVSRWRRYATSGGVPWRDGYVSALLFEEEGLWWMEGDSHGVGWSDLSVSHRFAGLKGSDA